MVCSTDDLLSILAYGVGSRAKHIKASPRVNCSEEKFDAGSSASSPPADESCARILNVVRILFWNPLYVFVIRIRNKTSFDTVEGKIEC